MSTDDQANALGQHGRPGQGETKLMTTHIDQAIESNSKSVDEVLTAKVTKSEESGTVGVPVFFSATDIEKQGIDPDEIDRLGVQVEDGFVLLVPIKDETGGTSSE
jgi:hypothetical protein